MKFGLLMTKNGDALQLLKSLNEGQKDGKGVSISRLNSGKLRATQSFFGVILIEVANFYIDNPTKSTNFRAPTLYRLGQQHLA